MDIRTNIRNAPEHNSANFQKRTSATLRKWHAEKVAAAVVGEDGPRRIQNARKRLAKARGRKANAWNAYARAASYEKPQALAEVRKANKAVLKERMRLERALRQ